MDRESKHCDHDVTVNFFDVFKFFVTFSLGFKFMSISYMVPEQGAYLEPYQASKNKCFAKTVSGFLPITIFKKHTTLNVCQGSEFTS